jgi:hypothetical protein
MKYPMKYHSENFIIESNVSNVTFWKCVKFLRKVRPDLPRTKKTIYISNL